MRDPSDTISVEYVEGAGLVYDADVAEPVRQVRVRVMSPLEIKQRLDLNVANTASALRARVVAELAKSNGHSTTHNGRRV